MRGRKHKKRSDGRYFSYVEGPDGKRKQLTAKTTAELDAKIKEANKAALDGTVKSSDDSFSRWSAEWLKAREPRTSAGQMKEYSGILKLLGPLGKMCVRDVRPKDIEALLASIAAKSQRGTPMSRSRLKKIKNCLEQTFEWLAQNQVLASDPAKLVRMPATPKPKDILPLEPEEISLVIAASQRMALGARVMLYCGLRKGELCALRWGDIDFERGAISVSRSADWDAGPGVDKEGTKNGESRTVLMPARLAAELAKNKASPQCFVLPLLSGGMMTESAWAREWPVYLKALSLQAGRPVSFRAHQLRHTCASQMYMAGVDPKTIAAQLGQKSLAITLGVYTDVSSEHIVGSLKPYFEKADAEIDAAL